MNQRLQQFLAAENVSQAQFAEFLGVARASVSHILAGRNKPSYEFICSMMVHYPNLNMEWLLTGKGKMYKKMSDSPAASEIFFAPEKPEPYTSEYDELPLSEDDDNEPVKIDFEPANPTKTSVPAPERFQSIQKTVTQRKVVKVTILFDDGTYQEL